MLLDSALAPSSHKTYQKAWTLYNEFLVTSCPGSKSLPSSVNDILMFISHCFDKQMASATVNTYCSALGYYNKLNNFNDPTQNFIVKKCLQGYKNLRPSLDARLPITPKILKDIIASLKYTCSSNFLQTMLKAMYLIAFHAFLRVGEFTCSNAKKTGHTLCVEDILFSYRLGDISGLEITFKSYKHSKGKQQTVFISCCKHDSNECPVHALHDYLILRMPSKGPLFTFMDDTPISRSFFTQQLKLSLAWAGCSTKSYKGHSFRIGAATSALMAGLAESKIQTMDRWSSNAYKKYIRIPMLSL